MDRRKKYHSLQEELKRYQKVAVAFSGGVDSTFLLRVAVDTLGCENVIAITADTCVCPRRELEQTKQLCQEMGVRQFRCTPDVFSIPQFMNNEQNRCYYCKKHMLALMKELAKEQAFMVLVEGSNEDDKVDYRPGAKAVMELEVASPLQSVGLTKEEIRSLSKELGLSTSDKPSFACLASRIPYGQKLTRELLYRVEQAEECLRQLGFRQYRVRVHEDLARIELLPEELERALDLEVRNQIVKEFCAYGFLYVSLDLAGYTTGNMNKMLKNINTND